jgi:serine/threonine-protein kinase RsbW
MVVPATLEGASQVAAEFRRRSAGFCEPGSAFACELLLREALTNAAEHGSQSNRGKEILCVIRSRRRGMFLWVQDQGPGFNWRQVLPLRSDPATPRGRGMEIYRTYATCVRFNAKGNAIALFKRF